MIFTKYSFYRDGNHKTKKFEYIYICTLQTSSYIVHKHYLQIFVNLSINSRATMKYHPSESFKSKLNSISTEL